MTTQHEQESWEKRWRKKYDIGSWVAPNGQRYTYSEIYGFIKSEIDLALQSHNDTLVAEIENLKVRCELCDNGEIHETHPVNEALDQVINIIKSK